MKRTSHVYTDTKTWTYLFEIPIPRACEDEKTCVVINTTILHEFLFLFELELPVEYFESSTKCACEPLPLCNSKIECQRLVFISAVSSNLSVSQVR